MNFSKFSSDQRIDLKRLFANLALTAISLIVALIGIETYTRQIIDTGMNYHLEMWKYAVHFKRVSESIDLGIEQLPGRAGVLMGVEVQTNTKKLRGDEVPHEKPAGTTRILMLGNSITLGWGVPNERTVSSQLENLLTGELTHPVEVINAGVGNYNTSMETAYYFSEGYKYNPDIIVLNFFLNDAEPLTTYEPPDLLAQYSYSWNFIVGSLDTVMRRAFSDSDWKSYYSSLYAPNSPGWASAKNGH